MLTPNWTVTPVAEQRKLVHVNATATGGGVAELLHRLVHRQRSYGTNTGWAVIDGNAEFYAVTKHLHHLLHGQADPVQSSDSEPFRIYRDVLTRQTTWFTDRLTFGDVVVLHDPQTLGLAPALRATGARVVWHCHIGTDVAPETGPATVWRAMAAELAALDAVITTMPEFAPPTVPATKRFVAAPAIDAEAAKNRELAPAEISALLDGAGLTAARSSPHVEVVQERLLPPTARVVLQVSRWDRLKDMPGVVRCVQGLPPDVHLVLAGSNPHEVPDDPEGLAVLAEVRETLAALPEAERARVHLMTLSMRAAEQNALLVNALQRRADVVVQKSLAEGFGLTVTEAMLKGRAVVAAAVGGLRTQVSHEHNGLLVDPTDHDEVRKALIRMLDDHALRRRLGRRARSSVLARFTIDRLVEDYARIAHPDLEVTA